MYAENFEGKHRGGRPPLGTPSKYLLTNLALCGVCGAPLRRRTRAHGSTRKAFYGCAGYHERGRSVCGRSADVPMGDADGIVLEALLDDVLTPDIIEDAVTAALRLLEGESQPDRLADIERELKELDRHRANLVAAIAAGGELESLVDALRTREERRGRLTFDRQRLLAQREISASKRRRVTDDLHALARDWRRVLVDDPDHARPVVSSLLVGRVTFTPMTEAKRWQLRGEGNDRGIVLD